MESRKISLYLIVFLAVTAIFVAAPTPPAHAQSVVGNGTPASCTEAALRSAIDGGGTVTFNCGGAVTIPITEELFFQDFDVTIDGGGNVTLQGTPGVHVIRFRTWGFDAAQTLTLRNLTITGASRTGSQVDANGAAIYVRNQSANFDTDVPTLNLENVTMTNNTSTQTNNASNPYDYGGGAVYILGGILNVSNSIFIGNRSDGGAGGAIHVLGSNLSVNNSYFDSNVATATNASSNNSGFGGAIYVDGTRAAGGGAVTIVANQFFNNAAANQGGFAYINLYPSRNSSLTVHRNAFIGNRVSGGAMGLGGALSGGGSGGEVPVFITDNLFALNSVAGGSRGASGGALAFAQSANLVISNSTFIGNRAEGVCSNCTNANGGAIYVTNNNTPFQVINSTIAFNYAGWVGGGITGRDGTLTNTVLAHNTAENGGNGWGIQQQCSSDLNDGGNNIQFPGRNPNPNFFNEVECTNNITVANPMFGLWNGFTLPLLPGSPAIDAGNNSVCEQWPVLNGDARGVSRGQGAACDIGAHESTPGELVNVMFNGGFDGGTSGYSFWGDVEQSESNGVLNMRRTNPNSFALVTQLLNGIILPQDSKVAVSVDLGNPAPKAKDVTLRLVDLDAGGSITSERTCFLRVPAESSLQTYRMELSTPNEWDIIDLQLFVDDFAAPALQVDNITVTTDPAISTGAVNCIQPTAPTNRNLAVNGSFDNGAAAFFTSFGLATEVQNNTFRMTRNVLFDGNNQPVIPFIAQNMRQGVPANAPLQATVQLGNTSNEGKLVSLHLWSFPDNTTRQACVFTVPPNTPLQTYTLQTITDVAWANIDMQLFLEDFGEQWLLVDDINVQHRTDAGITELRCDAPLPTNTNLVLNGDFDYGNIFFGAFGPLSTVESGGVLNITTNTAGQDVGLLAQPLFRGAPADAAFEVTVDMGNPTNGEKTVLLRLWDFPTEANQIVCLFPVGANTPLQTYTMRGQANADWTFMDLQVFIDDAPPALQLDNLSVVHRASIPGNELGCFEPGVSSAADVVEAAAPAAVTVTQEALVVEEVIIAPVDETTPTEMPTLAVAPITATEEVPASPVTEAAPTDTASEPITTEEPLAVTEPDAVAPPATTQEPEPVPVETEAELDAAETDQ